MRKMSEAEVMEEISRSSVFANIFSKTNEDTKQLFKKLASESSIYSCNDKGYVKNMAETGYRLAKPYSTGRKIQNYCMFTLLSNQIIIDIRTDLKPISSKTLDLVNRGNCFQGGIEWHRFRISEESDLPETLRLIEYCY